MSALLEHFKDDILKLLESWELSSRETEIAHLILQDKTSTKEIAEELEISPITVRNHLEKIYKKSNCKNKNQFIVTILHHFLQHNRNISMFYKEPRILVVDDEQYICDILKTSLGDVRAKVMTTTNAEEVAKLIRNVNFDFIITDMKMPGLNGQQLIKQIKSQHHQWPKVIVITGYSEYLPEELYNIGAVSFVTKPFTPENIYKIILENYVDENSALGHHSVDEETSVVLPGTHILKRNAIGIGGLFLPLSYETVTTQNLEPGTIVSFDFSVEDFGNKTHKCVGEVLWRRSSDNNGLVPGIGVKVLHCPFFNEDVFSNYLIQHDISSFIPLGEAAN